MSAPGQIVVLNTLPVIEGKEFWEQLRAVMEAHGRLLVPRADVPDAVVDEERLSLPGGTSKTEWDSLLEQAFLNAKRHVVLTPDWGEPWGPIALAILRQKPYIPRWGYQIEMCFERYVFNTQEARLCEAVTELCKDLFVQLPCDFGFACHEYLYKRHLRLFKSYRKDAKALCFIPTLPAEDEGNYLLVHDNPFWGLDDKPIWFYLLSRERYEASKPYLPNLPVEAIERFPHLQGYGVQRIEELPNGGAFIFFGHPYDFDVYSFEENLED
jgi:hypothetical protein